MNSKKYEQNTWQGIDWKVVEIAVFKLQKRIYKASQRGDVKAVHKLQRLLTNSYYGKLWSTRRVTQENQGKKTAGVDGIKSLKPKERLEMVKKIKVNGKSKPTRRVWIPKPNGDKRPLGIPTMEDRAKQCLVKLALEPQWESKFESNSYGFRPARSCHDAISAIFNAIRYEPKYVLDADISQCFDKIDHKILLEKLETYPSIRRQIKAWLKSGVVDGELFPTKEGTPQGGVVSPLLANIALHGMELEIKKLARSLKMKTRQGREITNKAEKEKKLHLIRYADDFVIMHDDIEAIERCQETIKSFLKQLGLELKPSKTKITHTLNEYQGNVGFDFLGFHIRQYKTGIKQSAKSPKGEFLGYKTIIKPSQESIKAHTKKLGDIIRSHRSASQLELIGKLNPIIRGWANYYRTVCPQEAYEHCDNVLYHQLKRWAKRRHPKKNGHWVSDKYWHHIGSRKWVFATKLNDKFITLVKHFDTEKVRHSKVKGDKSIYDGDFVYWGTRLGKHPELNTRKALLLKKQKGKCNYCKLTFRSTDNLEVDHITPKALGGKDIYSNLQLLHLHCHDKKSTIDLAKIKEAKMK